MKQFWIDEDEMIAYSHDPGLPELVPVREVSAPYDSTVKKMTEALDYSCYSKQKESCDCLCCEALKLWKKLND